jgi:hypothetical protein
MGIIRRPRPGDNGQVRAAHCGVFSQHFPHDRTAAGRQPIGRDDSGKKLRAMKVMLVSFCGNPKAAGVPV